MAATREEWQALYDKAKSANRPDLQRKIIEQLRAEKETKPPEVEQSDLPAFVEDEGFSIGSEIDQFVRQGATGVMGMLESGITGIGKLLSGDDISEATKAMGEISEKRLKEAQTPMAQDAMQMIGEVGEVIDEATFKAGSVAEDIPIVGPAVATGIKVTGDFLVGAAPIAATKLVARGAQAKKAASVSRATVEAELEAEKSLPARDNIFLRRQKYRKAQADQIFRDIKKGKRTKSTSLDITEQRFKDRYVQSRKRAGDDLSDIKRESNHAWRVYKKRKNKANQAAWDREEGAILQRMEDDQFQRKLQAEIDLPDHTVMEKIKNSASGASDTVGKLVGTVVTRLDSIDPTRYLSKKIRQMEHEIESNMVRRNKDLDNFYSISDEISKGKRADEWKAAYINGDINAMRQIAIEERPKVRKGLKKVEPDYKDTFDSIQFVLREMGVDAEASGFRAFKLIGPTINSTYLPRQFSYKQLQRLEKDPELAKTLGFDKDKLHKALTGRFDDEVARAEAINAALIGGGKARLPAPTPSSAKRRGQMQLHDLYDSPHESIHRYVNDMTEATAIRRFMGKRRVDGNADFEGSLAQFIQEHGDMMKLTPREQKVLEYTLGARFAEGRQHASRFVQNVKNIGYLTTIGNAWSALTQIGDSIIAAGHLGPMNVARGLADKIAGKGIKMQDIGYENIMKEMANPSKSAKWLDKTLEWSGFKAMDRFGKNVVVNGSRRRYQKLASSDKGRRKLAKDWGKLFKDPADFDQFVRDLQKGDVQNPNVAFAVFNDLADLQPITLSDMPISYLKHPNGGRLVWALKTWQANMLNKFWRDTVHEAKRGNKLTALKNTARFVTFNVIAGTAGVDIFKELIAKMAAGKELTGEDITDELSEAALRTAFINKYAVDRMQGPGDLWSLGTQVWAPSLPSTINRAWKGATKEEKRDELLKIMPVFGSAYSAYRRAKEEE